MTQPFVGMIFDAVSLTLLVLVNNINAQAKSSKVSFITVVILRKEGVLSIGRLLDSSILPLLRIIAALGMKGKKCTTLLFNQVRLDASLCFKYCG